LTLKRYAPPFFSHCIFSMGLVYHLPMCKGSLVSSVWSLLWSFLSYLGSTVLCRQTVEKAFILYFIFYERQSNQRQIQMLLV
jgi:hypothetical protein